MKTPERIIVRSPNWIGDQILSYPFFYFLRKQFPKSFIAAVCVPWVKSIQFRRQVDQVIEISPPEEEGVLSQFESLESTAKKIKAAGPWDLGICLPNSFSAAWVFFRGGVQRRRGYRADARSLLLHESLPWKKGIGLHRSDAYAQLIFESSSLDALRFWGAAAENELDPPLPGVLEKFDAASEWPGERTQAPTSGPYWVLAPGTTAESRQWPIHSYKEIASKVVQEFGWRGIILGGPKEKP
jgi:ADP-heptose:LPS heptosyltransferase